MPNQNTNKTHCPKGHPYSGINSMGRRICKICINERQRLRYKIPAVKKSKLDWQKNNKPKVNKNSRAWRKKNPNYFNEWDAANPIKRKKIYKKFNQTPSRKEYSRIIQLKYYHLDPEKYKAMQKTYRKEHPRSGAGYTLNEQIAMNQRRLIDKNICQWGRCNLRHKEIGIEVNHIFPRAKYPEQAGDIKNLICYCIWHHYVWHQIRGDPWAKLILKKMPRWFNPNDV